MHKKILWTASCVGLLLFAGSPGQSIQRFIIEDGQTSITIAKRPVPTEITALHFRGKDYLPMPSRRHKGWLEFNVAPDNESGPKPVYGEDLYVRFETDTTWMVVWCCVWYMETGHHKVFDWKTKLQFQSNENPECVIIYKNQGNLLTSAEPNKTEGNSSMKETTPLLKNY